MAISTPRSSIVLNQGNHHNLIRVAVKLLSSLLLTIIVSACATGIGRDAPAGTPATVEDRSIVDGDVLPLPDEPQIHTESLPAEQPISPVVQSLLVAAEQQRNGGEPDAAANSLERALRIEPGNAMLWSRLADVRYAQKDWQQAIQLAAKSNTLAGSNQQLRRQNWYLMANAYAALGDDTAAAKYRDKLSY